MPLRSSLSFVGPTTCRDCVVLGQQRRRRTTTTRTATKQKNKSTSPQSFQAFGQHVTTRRNWVRPCHSLALLWAAVLLPSAPLSLLQEVERVSARVCVSSFVFLCAHRMRWQNRLLTKRLMVQNKQQTADTLTEPSLIGSCLGTSSSNR